MSSNNVLPDPMISSASGHSVIQATPRRRKHRNSAVAMGFRLRGAQKKQSSNGSSPVKLMEIGLQENEVSARKLAAGLWQFQHLEVSGDGSAAFRYSSSFPSSTSQPPNGNVKIMFPLHHDSEENFKEIKDQLRRPITILRSRNGLRRELESCTPCLKCSKKDATKWNPALNNEASDEFGMIHSNNHLEDQKTNLKEEKVFWKCSECQKFETMLENLKDKLARERRSRERMELLNAKLVNELTKANLSAEQFMTNYEKEKQEKELIAKLCNQLAMQIGEDKARLEGLLSYSLKIRDEVEEERKMMQMAELWREERVQMKLLDAKFVLEDKYNQMVQLIALLQMLLSSRVAKLDTMELEDAQLIKQAVESVNIQRIVELSYDFLELDNIISIFEELRKCNMKEGMIKPDSHSTPSSHLSAIHIENLDEEMLNKNSMFHYSSPSSNYDIGLELTKSSETVGHIKDQKFSSAPEKEDTYFVNVNQDKDILDNEAECSKKAYLKSLRMEVHGVSSLSTGQLKRKASLPSKQPCSNAGGRTTSVKCSLHKRLSDGGIAFSQCEGEGSIQGSFKHSELLEQGNSAYNMNPHITRGMKGCTEWPRGITKSSFKVIPFGKKSEKSKFSVATHI